MYIGNRHLTTGRRARPSRPLRFAVHQRAKLLADLPKSPAARLLRSCVVPSRDCSECQLGAEATFTLAFWTSSADPERSVQCVHVNKLLHSMLTLCIHVPLSAAISAICGCECRRKVKKKSHSKTQRRTRSHSSSACS